MIKDLVLAYAAGAVTSPVVLWTWRSQIRRRRSPVRRIESQPGVRRYGPQGTSWTKPLTDDPGRPIERG